MRLKKLLALLVTLMYLAMILPASADKTVTITFTGDVTLGCEERVTGLEGSFNDYANRMGYGYFFRNMLELFSSDDLTVVNLEGVLSDSGAQENTKKTYRFRGTTDYVEILKSSSIELCSLANNHVMDYGNQGFRSTKNTLDENEIGYFGTRDYYIFEKDGIKIAFFSLLSSAYLNNWQWCRDRIKKLRESEEVNAVVFCFHAGREYSTTRNTPQEQYAKGALVFMGADLVVMHHPHVLQGVDTMNNRYIFYSLGNFCFGGNMLIRALETAVLQADLVFSDEGEYLGQRARIYPARTSSAAEAVGDSNDYQPRFARNAEEAEAALALIQQDSPNITLGQWDPEKGCVELPFLGPDE